MAVGATTQAEADARRRTGRTAVPTSSQGRRIRPMGRRSRRRAKHEDRAPAATTDYTDEVGNILTLRDELSAGTLRALHDLDAKPAASAEDRWQRRAELLFERLAVRWVIADLPLDGQ